MRARLIVENLVRDESLENFGMILLGFNVLDEAYYGTKDPEDIRNLVSNNVGIANYVASTFYDGHDVPYSDLLSTAREGLFVAADRWDPSHGAPFAPYAFKVVRAFVIRSLKKRDKERTVSINSTISNDEDGKSFEDVLPGDDDTAENAMSSMDRPDMLKALRSAMETSLLDNEKAAVQAYFIDGLNLRDAGEKLGINRVSLQRLLVRAVDKLRSILRKQGFEPPSSEYVSLRRH